ncbi:MAG: lysoplasmalogenase family protein, partial [Anaerolineae bacterium]|nr:lysoplasmalogenase family protein [Anaerolineae bacterium]
MTTALGGLVGWMLLLGTCCAAVNWVAVARGIRRLETIFKPATLTAFVMGAWLLGQHLGGGRLALWFVVALLFSLVGDIFLMLP